MVVGSKYPCHLVVYRFCACWSFACANKSDLDSQQPLMELPLYVFIYEDLLFLLTWEVAEKVVKRWWLQHTSLWYIFFVHADLLHMHEPFV